MKSNFTEELERDIRSRVNPQYAHINGTESYERKAMLDEIDRLRAAIVETLNANLYLCCGKQCALSALKRAVNFNETNHSAATLDAGL
jgi:hypothetical protein